MPIKILPTLCLSGTLLFTACQQPTTNITTTSVPLNAEVEAQVDNRINYFIKVYGSKEKLEQITGKTIQQMKEEYRPIIAQQLMIEAK